MYDAEAIKPIICERIATGKSLKDICAEKDMPTRETIYAWLREDSTFSDMYARAREEQADYLADEIVDIADTEKDAAKARNRIDARKWKASKLQPRVYGDKIDVNHSGSIQTMPEDKLNARLSELLGKAGVAIPAAGGGPAEADEQA